MHGQFQEVGMQVAVGIPRQAYPGVVMVVADGVTLELDRRPPHVFDRLGFFLEEIMYPVSGEEQEGPLIAEVLEVGAAVPLAPAALEFGGRYVVLGEQLVIDLSQVLGVRDCALHIEPVPVLQVAQRQLLNESTHRGCRIVVVHRTPLTSKTPLLKGRDCFKAHSLEKPEPSQ